MKDFWIMVFFAVTFLQVSEKFWNQPEIVHISSFSLNNGLIKHKILCVLFFNCHDPCLDFKAFYCDFQSLPVEFYFNLELDDWTTYLCLCEKATDVWKSQDGNPSKLLNVWLEFSYFQWKLHGLDWHILCALLFFSVTLVNSVSCWFAVNLFRLSFGGWWRPRDKVKLLLLMILLSVKDVLWHVVRIPVFQEPDHFTLSFPWIRKEKTVENLLLFKGFLNSVFSFGLFSFP